MIGVRALMALVLVLGGVSTASAADAEAWPFGLPSLDQSTFNRTAVLVNQRVNWRTDTTNPGVLDPSELTVPGSSSASVPWIKDGAFHPKFKDNGQVFVYYNPEGKPRGIHLSRFTRSKDDPNKADPDSEEIILELKQPFSNHNGGPMGFAISLPT